MRTNTAAFGTHRNWRRSAILVSAMLGPLIYAAGALAAMPRETRYYLPDAKASKIVSVAAEGKAAAEVIISTEWVGRVKNIGEVYEFSPRFFAVRREEPTMLSFWSLHNEEHDFTLIAPDSSILMRLKLQPLAKTSYVFTFHKEGLYNFDCLMHPPEMTGQILVLPPLKAK